MPIGEQQNIDTIQSLRRNVILVVERMVNGNVRSRVRAARTKTESRMIDRVKIRIDTAHHTGTHYRGVAYLRNVVTNKISQKV